MRRRGEVVPFLQAFFLSIGPAVDLVSEFCINALLYQGRTLDCVLFLRTDAQNL